MSDSTFTRWLKNGVRNVKMLYKDNVFISFDQIRENFSSPAHDFFRYLQVRHFVQSHFIQFPVPTLKLSLDLILENPPEVKGTVSRLYTMIFEMEGSSLSILKENWEKDLDTSISEDQWASIIQRIHSSSICARHSFIQFKIVLYMSKVKLSKIFSEVSPICEKCKQAPATLYHSLWSCPNLTAFWSSKYLRYSQQSQG